MTRLYDEPANLNGAPLEPREVLSALTLVAREGSGEQKDRALALILNICETAIWPKMSHRLTPVRASVRTDEDAYRITPTYPCEEYRVDIIG